jgi:hypothetical protein
VLNHPAVVRFIAVVESWNAGEWGCLLLWEVLEGKKEKPFKFLPALSEEDTAMLKTLRDELKVWPYFVTGKWDLFPIAVWREFASAHSADSVRERLCR